MAISCPSCQCCDTCCALGAARASTSTGLNSLKNLLPIGALTIQLPHGFSIPCSHAHAEDDWHGLGVNEIRSFTSLGHDDNSILAEIGFLMENEFIVATYRSSNTRMLLRIYLVPYDLPGMGGRLKCRKKHVVSRARRALSVLMLKVQASDWQGPLPATPVFSFDKVRPYHRYLNK